MLPAVLALFCILAAGSQAKAQGNALGYQVSADSSGHMTLKITVDAPAPGMWLGVTFYPPNVQNPAKDGVNRLFALKNGRGIFDVPVEPRFKNGSFEAAVWSRKLTGAECPDSDAVCRTAGYKLTGMRAYAWGYLTGP
jgi:hypothetical protein